MSVVGMISEYNPFHNGHAYLLSKASDLGDGGVVVVMSGNFTQRALPAILEKRARTQAALRGGADLVLELPLPFAVSGAQAFARGGVETLSATGLVDTLVFGSECGDTALLSAAAQAVEDAAVEEKLLSDVQAGKPYAAAREEAVRAVCGDALADVLQMPNNILGVEYIRAIRRQNAAITPKTFARVGAAHDGDVPSGSFASASYLRERITEGADVSAYLPAASAEILNAALRAGTAPADFRKLDLAILSFLRKCTPADFREIPDAGEGIENRILAAVKTARTLWDVFDGAKTKRYTHARIRRIVLHAFLGIRRTYAENGVPYLRVLGFTEHGKDLLRAARDTARLPIVMRASDVQSLSPAAQAMFRLECTATDIFNLTLPEIRPCGTDMTDGIVQI